MEKNHKNAEVRYAAGKRNDRRLWQSCTEHENPMSVQEEIDQLRDAHRRTALALVCQLLRNDPSLTPGLLLLRLRTEMRNSEWFDPLLWVLAAYVIAFFEGFAARGYLQSALKKHFPLN